MKLLALILMTFSLPLATLANDCESTLTDGRNWADLTPEEKNKTLSGSLDGDFDDFEEFEFIIKSYDELADVPNLDDRKFIKEIIEESIEVGEAPSDLRAVDDEYEVAGGGITLFYDPEGNRLGAYFYIIKEFQQGDYEDTQMEFWLNGYFDENGQFVGRGGNSDGLVWWRY